MLVVNNLPAIIITLEYLEITCRFIFTSEIIFSYVVLLLMSVLPFHCRSPFSISCKAGLMVINSSTFSFSLDLLQFCRTDLLGGAFPGQFFSFNILVICHSRLAYNISAKKCSPSVMGRGFPCI